MYKVIVEPDPGFYPFTFSNQSIERTLWSFHFEHSAHVSCLGRWLRLL